MLDWSRESHNPDFAFPNFSPQPQPQFDTIFAASLFFWTAKSTFRSRIFWRCSLSLNECTTFVSRSLLPFDCALKTDVATDSLSNSAPVSWRPGRHMTCSQCPEARMTEQWRTLLAAACLMLLDAPEFGKPSGFVGIMVALSGNRKLRWRSGRLIGVCSVSMLLKKLEGLGS